MTDVETWLLDADPALRWQVERDLLGASPGEFSAHRARVATQGWGAAVLAQQSAEGLWGGAAWNRGWNSTLHALTLLREFGLDPCGDAACTALRRVQDHVTWRGCGPDEVAHHRFFEGETEPCINGQVAACGAYFRQDVEPLIRRLLGEQRPDGGWNCEHESRHSSFNTTLCVLEALLEYQQARGDDAAVVQAAKRGQDYLLDRHLFRRLSTGAPITRDRKGGASWTDLAFPCWWHYDLLRGLDYLQRSGRAPDERVTEAVAMLMARRAADGRWRIDRRHAGTMLVDLAESEGAPSRWITLRALRVLRWHSGAQAS